MTDKGLTALVVDDELPQRDDMARMLRKSRRVETVDVASSAHDALLTLTSRTFDVIFLDIRMPGLDGFELAEVLHALPGAPALVFVSAYDASAAATFGFRAVDFLIKPVTPERIDETLARVASRVPRTGTTAGTTQQCHTRLWGCVVVVRDLGNRTFRLLARGSILYIMARGDYVRVHADSGVFLLRSTLADVERRLGEHGFLRVHRQFVANLARATEVRPDGKGSGVIRLENGDEIPVSRREMPELRRRLQR